MTEHEQFSNLSDEPAFNAKAVTMQTGVSPATLRAWERRYGILLPDRTSGGHRLYSERDIASIKWLKQQIDQGLTISRAAAMLQHLRETGEAPAAILSANAPSQAARPLTALQQELHQALIDYDEAAADELLTEAYALYPIETVCTDLIQMVLRELGEDWADESIQVATEHFASNYLRRKLIALIDTGVATRPGTIVAGCAPDDLHEMGTLLLSIFLRRRGWQVIYLGQAVPLNDLPAALTDIEADVLIMGAPVMDSAKELMHIQRTLDRIDAARRPVFAFGGPAFNQEPKLRDKVQGVFLGETIQAGVEAVERLMAERKK
jgi:DNA-binding transcriptional MerR regulator/methylmalonyl-CoA mutase cobalamin-binding subunit